MTAPLQIHDRRERALVRLADAVLRPLAWARPRARGPASVIERVLLLRLERIGDLLMTLDAIADARAAWPRARLDLAVGSWNAPLARLIPNVDAVLVADVPWLAREGTGETWPALVAKARAWRARAYDLIVNFEPDIRTNALAWIAGGRLRVGYSTGGGGALLTDAVAYVPAAHVTTNARALVRLAANVARASISGGVAAPPDHDVETGSQSLPFPRLRVSDDAARRAAAVVASATRPLIGVHVSGGRESKQWHVDRFAAAARALATTRGGTIILTGSTTDRPLVARAMRDLEGTSTIDAAGALDLPALAALLGNLDVLLTGDTGPMHLAAAMGTPVVALFGPSNPARYGPYASAGAAILRVDLPCSPCGQVRLPPARCRGHVPECLDRITVDDVVSATSRLLDAGRRDRRGGEAGRKTRGAEVIDDERARQ